MKRETRNASDKELAVVANQILEFHPWQRKWLCIKLLESMLNDDAADYYVALSEIANAASANGEDVSYAMARKALSADA